MNNLQASAQKQLRQFIEQIERLEEEKKGIAADISDKFTEAKAVGFDAKVMKRIIKARKLSKVEREEEEALFETYARAVGLLGTPLGEYADRVSGDADTAETVATL